MEYLLGLLTGVAFFICVGGTYYIGYTLGARKQPSAIKEVDEEDKQRRERFDKHFKALFSYDVDTAYGKKVE